MTGHRPPRKRRSFREIVVFLPYDGPGSVPPIEAARELVAFLGVEHAIVGTDVLTGGVEVRLLYDAGVNQSAVQYLEALGIPFEIEAR